MSLLSATSEIVTSAIVRTGGWMRYLRMSLCLGLPLLAACAEQYTKVNDAMLAHEEDGTNWPSYGRTFSENHYSPLTAINTENVSQLGLAWSYDIDVPLRADSQPLAVNGVIYIATGLSVVQALEAETGKLLWRYDPELHSTISVGKSLPSWGIRGLAMWEDKIIVGLQDGRLVALDAADGSVVWSVQTLDEKVDKFGEATITGAPRVFNGKVIIGFGGAERWARGAVGAYDVDTGQRLWRFYTVPGNPAEGFEDDAMKLAAETWSGEWWKYGGGGTVWNSIVYDPQFERLYLGTGNGGPWNWNIRNPEGKDELFLASIVALDANTGKYVWHYQQNPNEAWDYNATMDIELATLRIEGRTRHVLMQAPKNGYYYVLDREDGSLISAEKLGRVTWSERIDLKSGRPVDVPGSRYEHGPVIHWPGTFGIHNWQPMSFSPKSQWAYIPTIRQADIYSNVGVEEEGWSSKPYAWNTGLGGETAGLTIDSDEFGSSLLAWDPVLQKARWRVETPGVVNGGTMATAGDLVFQGHVDGTFNAYNAVNGAKIWTFNAGVSVLGAPISFSVGNVQYIAVLSAPPAGAAGGSLTSQAKYGWRYRDHPKRLLVFKLNGAAILPPTPPPGPAEPIRQAEFAVDDAMAATGRTNYSNLCEACHGVGVVASGGAPDLRASRVVLDARAFAAIARDGLLAERGMPGVKFLSDEDLLQLRHYIRLQAERPTPQSNSPSGV